MASLFYNHSTYASWSLPWAVLETLVGIASSLLQTCQQCQTANPILQSRWKNCSRCLIRSVKGQTFLNHRSPMGILWQGLRQACHTEKLKAVDQPPSNKCWACSVTESTKAYAKEVLQAATQHLLNIADLVDGTSADQAATVAQIDRNCRMVLQVMLVLQWSTLPYTACFNLHKML